MLVAVHYLQCIVRKIYPSWKCFYDSVFLFILQIFCVTRIYNSHPQYIIVVCIPQTVQLESCLTKSDVVVLERSKWIFFGRTKICFQSQLRNKFFVTMRIGFMVRLAKGYINIVPAAGSWANQILLLVN